MKATSQDISLLEKLYKDRAPYHGQLHDHASTGGRSDGKCTLDEWKEDLKALDLDFTTILDHRQVRHMHLPEWDPKMFIGGTEPGTIIDDSSAQEKMLHYLMIFPKHEQLETLLTTVERYEYDGTPDGQYRYRHFTVEEFGELAQTVKRLGGLFVHAHPKQIMISDDPLDYWFADDTGLEVFYTCHCELEDEPTANNYKLWTDLLALDKRVWASSGSDKHALPNTSALTTLYAREKTTDENMNQVYLSYMREGDFTAGSVGIRMSIGDATMGGIGSFDGNRVLFSVGDMHSSAYFADHTYRVALYDDGGKVFETTFDASQTNYFAWDADASRKFYRVVVWDDTLQTRIAVGNPIWNAAYFTE